MNKNKRNNVLKALGALTVLGFSTVSIASCSPIDADDVINNLLPNVWVFLSHLFATVVLISVCIWMVWRPMKETLEKRRNYIAKEILDAEIARKEAFEKLAQAEQEKMDAHAKAQIIVDTATNQGYQTKEKLEQEAKNIAKRMTEDAKNEASKIQIKMKQTMEQEILDIALSASAALLQDNVSEKDNEKFLKDFINQIEKE